jgi:hypothetical protein
MHPQCKPGGDAYDILPDLIGQSSRHIKEKHPTSLRCPNCGTTLVDYYDF